MGRNRAQYKAYYKIHSRSQRASPGRSWKRASNRRGSRDLPSVNLHPPNRLGCEQPPFVNECLLMYCHLQAARRVWVGWTVRRGWPLWRGRALVWLGAWNVIAARPGLCRLLRDQGRSFGENHYHDHFLGLRPSLHLLLVSCQHGPS